MGKAEDLSGDHNQMSFSSEIQSLMIITPGDVIRLNDTLSGFI